MVASYSRHTYCLPATMFGIFEAVVVRGSVDMVIPWNGKKVWEKTVNLPFLGLVKSPSSDPLGPRRQGLETISDVVKCHGHLCWIPSLPHFPWFLLLISQLVLFHHFSFVFLSSRRRYDVTKKPEHVCSELLVAKSNIAPKSQDAYI